MKKLILILLVMLPALAFGRIGIYKTGDLIKVTGLNTSETTLMRTSGTVYLSNITAVMVNGRTIYFYQGKDVVMSIRYTNLTTKYGTSSATGFVEYLISNEFL